MAKRKKTQDAHDVVQNEDMSGFDSGDKAIFRWTLKNKLQGTRDIIIHELDGTTHKQIFIATKVDGGWTIEEFLKKSIERVRVHKLAFLTQVNTLCGKLIAMYEGRLRFLTKAKSDGEFPHPYNERSFGQLVHICSTVEAANSFVWEDPDATLAMVLSISAVRELVWHYALALERHHHDLRELKFHHATACADIFICPSVLFQDFRVGYKPQCTNFNLGSMAIKGDFCPQAYQDESMLLENQFHPRDWRHLPRSIQFMYDPVLWPIGHRRADVSLANIVLFNNLAKHMVQCVKLDLASKVAPSIGPVFSREVTFGHKKPTVVCREETPRWSQEIYFGRSQTPLMWKYPPIPKLVELWHNQFGVSSFGGFIEESKFMTFILQHAVFVGEEHSVSAGNHLACIRDLRYGEHIPITCTRWQCFAAEFRYGMKTSYDPYIWADSDNFT
jgi:hypothetical protein